MIFSEQQRASVALAQRAFLKHCQHRIRQVEKPEQVGDCRAAAADATANGLLRHSKLFDERRYGARLFNRVEVGASHVLDNCGL